MNILPFSQKLGNKKNDNKATFSNYSLMVYFCQMWLKKAWLTKKMWLCDEKNVNVPLFRYLLK